VESEAEELWRWSIVRVRNEDVYNKPSEKNWKNRRDDMNKKSVTDGDEGGNDPLPRNAIPHSSSGLHFLVFFSLIIYLTSCHLLVVNTSLSKPCVSSLCPPSSPSHPGHGTLTNEPHALSTALH
jgi:hypothetical protein